ncbi:MAG: DUF4382 domain-containing protein [Pseudomonadota bacterium]
MKRFACVFALALAGCGGGSSFNEPAFDAPAAPSTVTLLVTDAPIDTVQAVNVQFAAIALQDSLGNTVELPLATPDAVDLLQLQGGTTATLVGGAEIPPGSYTSFRLRVNASFDSVFDSFAVRNGGQIEIEVPGGEIDVPGSLQFAEGQSASLVIDWDLRQSLTEPLGQPGFVLQPGIRLLDTASSGSLSGTVSDLLIDDALNGDATCANDLMADTGNAVYVYDGTVEAPDDIQPGDVSPLTTATVSFDGARYAYSVGFLGAGNYTLALTCQGLADDPETDDAVEFALVLTDVSVEAGSTTMQNFP